MTNNRCECLTSKESIHTARRGLVDSAIIDVFLLSNTEKVCLKIGTTLLLVKNSTFENLPGNNRASIAEQNFSLWYAVLSAGGSRQIRSPVIFVNK